MILKSFISMVKILNKQKERENYDRGKKRDFRK